MLTQAVPSAQSAPTAQVANLAELPRIPVGTSVEYYSKTFGGWKPAVVEGFNEEWGTYTLDIQPAARLESVRFPAGAAVEYYSASLGGWRAAVVEGFNDEWRTYALDIQPAARPDRVRAPQAAALHESESMSSATASAAATAATAATATAAALGPVCVAASDGGGEVSVDDVVIHRADLKGGGAMILVSDAAGGRLASFGEEAVSFELSCDADGLRAWLEGISSAVLPGLLLLLSSEVVARGERLKTCESERDTARGDTDYAFFGLDGEGCSDRDIDRAYRRASQKLHPDKGGSEEQFHEMHDRYQQLKTLRDEGKATKSGGGSITWDQHDRVSMLHAHGELRDQLVWITRKVGELERQLEDFKRARPTRCLADVGANP